MGPLPPEHSVPQLQVSELPILRVRSPFLCSSIGTTPWQQWRRLFSCWQTEATTTKQRYITLPHWAIVSEPWQLVQVLESLWEQARLWWFHLWRQVCVMYSPQVVDPLYWTPTSLATSPPSTTPTSACSPSSSAIQRSTSTTTASWLVTLQ